MSLILVEISKEEFQFLSDLSCNYFQNGVIYSDAYDNVIAFERVDLGKESSFTYWKVIEKK